MIAEVDASPEAHGGRGCIESSPEEDGMISSLDEGGGQAESHRRQPTETEPQNVGSGHAGPEEKEPTAAQRRRMAFFAKRPHKKSRGGCTNCKTRKVKCNEARPQCRACTLRSETCVYLKRDDDAGEKEAKSESGSLVVAAPTASPAAPLLPQPTLLPKEFDMIDMKLLWYFTSRGYYSFAAGTGRHQDINDLLQTVVPAHMPDSRYLVDCLLALSALDLQQQKHQCVQGVPGAPRIEGDPGASSHHQLATRLPVFDVEPARVWDYRARAFASYRQAVETAHPGAAEALLTCSLLVCGLASQMFRDENAPPLCVLDWMVVWRGISLIIHRIRPPNQGKSDWKAPALVSLLTRPSIDFDVAARHIPNALLYMVCTMAPDDPDHSVLLERDPEFPGHDCTAVYHTTLKFLGSLFWALDKIGPHAITCFSSPSFCSSPPPSACSSSTSPSSSTPSSSSPPTPTSSSFNDDFVLRIIAFFTHVPGPFVQLARERRPRALVIIAHYLVFFKLFRCLWWTLGIAEKEIPEINAYLAADPDYESTWRPLLRVPLAAIETDDPTRITRLLLEA